MKKLVYLFLAMTLAWGALACKGRRTGLERRTTRELGQRLWFRRPRRRPSDSTDTPGDTNSVLGHTLIVYYSYTNHTHTIVTELQKLVNADVVRVEPAQKGIDYAANNYAIGSALIAAIRENPDDAASYPAIDPVEVDFSSYNTIVVGAPLWWSNMAAPLQTFLFNYGSRMAGKQIGLIVSSASSGISGVEADARRLIPNGGSCRPASGFARRRPQTVTPCSPIGWTKSACPNRNYYRPQLLPSPRIVFPLPRYTGGPSARDAPQLPGRTFFTPFPPRRRGAATEKKSGKASIRLPTFCTFVPRNLSE